MTPLSYKKAGVDIEKEDEAIESLKKTVLFAREGLGAPLKSEFTGFVDFGEYALSLCTDGVGTKLIVANKMSKWDTVGIDCIAMNVNDAICHGAEPIAFVDYLAMEDPDPELTEEIGKGLQKGAEMANMTIIGGETATLGDIVKGFDLAGTALGFVKKEDIIDGQDIEVGDKIIGLSSSGLHSNGFTLARRVLEKCPYPYHDELEFGMIGEVMLEPTKIYVKPIMDLLEEYDVKGMANITGGGLKNIPRINKDFKYVIEDPLEPKPIFKFLQEEGDVTDKDMYKTFNMGMGFSVIVSEEIAEDVVEKVDGKVVGTVEKGEGAVHEPKNLKYK